VYRVEGSVEDVELKALVAALAGASEDYRGRVSGSISLGGVLGTNAVSRAHGEGTVAVRDGQIFRLPLFGGLTYYLTRFVPGLNFVVAQSDAKSSFLIGDGKIHTGEVLVEGDVLSLRGRGEYAFDRSLDFKVQVRLLKHKTVAGKIVQFLTSPISKFFEFRLRGTLDKPRWYVRTFSKDLLVQLGLRKKPVPEAVETEEFVPVEALVQEVAP